MISNLIIPVIVLGIIIYGFSKKVDIYDEFLVGVREGLDMSLKLFSTIFAMILAINVLIKSDDVKVIDISDVSLEEGDVISYGLVDFIFNTLYVLTVRILPLF